VTDFVTAINNMTYEVDNQWVLRFRRRYK